MLLLLESETSCDFPGTEPQRTLQKKYGAQLFTMPTSIVTVLTERMENPKERNSGSLTLRTMSGPPGEGLPCLRGHRGPGFAAKQRRLRSGADSLQRPGLKSGKQSCGRTSDVNAGAPLCPDCLCRALLSRVHWLSNAASLVHRRAVSHASHLSPGNTAGRGIGVSNITSRLCKEPHLFLVLSTFSASPMTRREAHAGGPGGFK